MKWQLIRQKEHQNDNPKKRIPGNPYETQLGMVLSHSVIDTKIYDMIKSITFVCSPHKYDELNKTKVQTTK